MALPQGHFSRHGPQSTVLISAVAALFLFVLCVRMALAVCVAVGDVLGQRCFVVTPLSTISMERETEEGKELLLLSANPPNSVWTTSLPTAWTFLFGI